MSQPRRGPGPGLEPGRWDGPINESARRLRAPKWTAHYSSPPFSFLGPARSGRRRGGVPQGRGHSAARTSPIPSQSRMGCWTAVRTHLIPTDSPGSSSLERSSSQRAASTARAATKGAARGRPSGPGRLSARSSTAMSAARASRHGCEGGSGGHSRAARASPADSGFLARPCTLPRPPGRRGGCGREALAGSPGSGPRLRTLAGGVLCLTPARARP